MSLINDQNKDNSGVETPDTPNIRTVRPSTLEQSTGSFSDATMPQVPTTLQAEEEPPLFPEPIEPEAPTTNIEPVPFVPSAQSQQLVDDVFKYEPAPELNNANIVPLDKPYTFQTIPDATSYSKELLENAFKQQKIERNQSIEKRRQQNPNVTRSNGIWDTVRSASQSPVWRFLDDVWGGTQKGRELANKGEWDFFQGAYGNLGAGLSGFLGTTLGAPVRLGTGYITDLLSVFSKEGAETFNPLTASDPILASAWLAGKANREFNITDSLAGFGNDVSTALFGKKTIEQQEKERKERQERLKNSTGKDATYWKDYWDSLFDKPWIVFDAKNAAEIRKKYGSAILYSLGNPIDDINNPIDPSTGRLTPQNNALTVFGSGTRANPDIHWAQDPVGTGLHIAWQLLNPFDDLAFKPIGQAKKAISETVTSALPNGRIVTEKPFKSADEIYKSAVSAADKNKKIQLNLPNAKLEVIEGEYTAAIKQAQETLAFNKQDPDWWFEPLSQKAVPDAQEVIEKVGKTGRANQILKDSEKLLPTAKDVAVRKSTPTLMDEVADLAAAKQDINNLADDVGKVLDNSLDLGRKPIDTPGFKPTSQAEMIDVLQKGGEVNVIRKAFDVLPKGLSNLLKKGDLQSFTQKAEVLGRDFVDDIAKVAQRHNELLTTPGKPSSFKSRYAKPFQADLYHGTAIENWSPKYNLSLYGSRGELGSGLYLTRNLDEASDYARATTNANLNPEMAASALKPSLNQVKVNFAKSLDANLKISTQDQIFVKLVKDLPVEITEPLKKLLIKRKNITFNGFMDKLDNALVKSNLGTDEGLLRKVSETVSDNLRSLGFDGVVDNKAGWVNVLDADTTTLLNKSDLANPTLSEASSARYNTESLAKKKYPKRLTTDANLREASYTKLRQKSNELDTRLDNAQKELGRRLEFQTNARPDASLLSPDSGVLAKNADVVDAVYKGNEVEFVKSPTAVGDLTTLPSTFIRKTLTDAVTDKSILVDKFDEADDLLSTSKEIFAPELIVQKDGSLITKDGGHRIKAMLDEGFDDIPVVVDNSSGKLQKIELPSQKPASFADLIDDVPPSICDV